MARPVKIQVKNVSKTFVVEGGGTIQALDNVSIDILENEFLAVVGPSGCGKSTLLFIIAGLVSASAGSVSCDGKTIVEPHPSRGVVFQEDAVFPWLSVRKNIEYGPRRRGYREERIREITDKYLKLVGLKNYETLWPKQLSGGMRKRVDLGRALANDPDILLMDEPFGALDVITKEHLQVQLGELFTSFKKTVFFVTHDLEEAIFLADRVVVFTARPGRVRTTLEIPFGRPRLPEIKTSGDFQHIREVLGKHLTDGDA